MQIWTDASFDHNTKEAGLGIMLRQRLKNGMKETRLSLSVKAEDNNQAELLAIYHALQHIKGVPDKEPLFIITDSTVAIDSIKHPEHKPEKYKEIAERIRGMLFCEKWKIYHRKAHTERQDRYSVNQAITDYLAKQGRR